MADFCHLRETFCHATVIQTSMLMAAHQLVQATKLKPYQNFQNDIKTILS